MKMVSGPSQRIVQRIQDFFAAENICGGNYDPYRPASHLLQNHMDYVSRIDDETVERAATMFDRINSLLQTPSPSESAMSGLREEWTLNGSKEMAGSRS